jgi:MFS transporter, DHA1 family, multidrug resistance protein
MDIVDRDMERAEIEATRQWSHESKERRSLHSQRSQQSVLSSSSGSSSGSRPDMGRIATAGQSSATVPSYRAARTRTHPIEDHRTETHRLQHIQTVGATEKTRSKTEARPLPEFGGGKPYPPDLPPQEEYVVEFDGKDDPLHPQNWPFKRK